MTDKDSKKSDTSEGKDGGKQRGAETPDTGIKSRLTDAQKEMLASKSRGGAGSQSVGHSHKPTHASGKQGPAEKKVRW
ncbi:hypothetical protein E5206_01855 [Arthrobacter sp. PAMC25564]|uniref:hypothetical protein n=1 Tax=Arthrobacter sp. PAMC25564 TaxID=2565366 RepID=UPI0010A2092C|nr:hypothetical protein [Arthrobacter sp. PAMC25564]QCB95824.1 hypothetical protein E5206_01855 [Arthrobacter sp. PAMC25564]